jgi:hypothetical protein
MSILVFQGSTGGMEVGIVDKYLGSVLQSWKTEIVEQPWTISLRSETIYIS